MLQNYWKFQNRSVQTFGFVYHDTNGLNHGPVWKTQSFLLSEICMANVMDVLSRLPRCARQAAHKWPKSCGRYQTGGQDRKHRTDLENCHGRRWSGTTNIISWTRVFGLHSQRVSNQQTYWGELRRIVRIQDFWWRQRKTTDQSFRETWRRNNFSWFFDMEGHAKKCVERCCEFANKTTQQLYEVATPWDDHQFKEEQNVLAGELNKKCQQYAHKMFWHV